MPADITHVSVTFHDERKREEYGPVKKAEATISATVSPNEDGAAVLDHISFVATNKVRQLLSIEGATAPQQPAVSAAATGGSQRASPAASPETSGGTDVIDPKSPPPTHIRRTKDELARGLTVEQAAAERAGGVVTPGPAAPAISEQPTEATTPPSGDATTQTTAPSSEWDGPAPVVITDVELNTACADAAARCGDPLKVRALKEPYNPSPGQPFLFTQIPQNFRAEVLEKLKAL